MTYPTVSVIVLNYNGLRYMEDCFSSLGQLDYPPDRLELVLADNASCDESVAYVREHFPHVKLIQFDQNYGIAVAYNRAAQQLSSDYVAFLNSDVRVQPGWLSGLLDALQDEAGVVCAGSKMLNWDGRLIDFGGILLSFLGHGRSDGYHDPDLTAYDHVRYILAACSGAMLIDRKVFLEVGGFDGDFDIYFDDIDLGWRLWILGYKVVFAPQSLCYHVHFGTMSKQPSARVNYLYERNALYTIIKNYEQPYLDRVLPVALLMHFKRAYLLAQSSGLAMDKSRFKLTTARSVKPQPEPAYDAGHYLRQAWQTVRSEGLLALLRASLDELARRRGQFVPKLTPEELAVLQSQPFWASMAHLTAANDVIDKMGLMMEKRAVIQKGRRRSDQDIFKTVRALSFEAVYDMADYVQAQQRLLDAFGIPALLGDAYDPAVPFMLRLKE